MPKGIRKTEKNEVSIILNRIGQMVVPVGAKVYPESQCVEFPEGIPVPYGVRIRTARSIEVRFQYKQERVSEPIRGVPTVNFVQMVGKKLNDIQQLIALNKFDDVDYQKEFPKSRRTVAAETISTFYTVREALEDWLASCEGTISVNSMKDYVRAVNNQLIPLKLPEECRVQRHNFVKPGPQTLPPASWALTRVKGGPKREIDASDYEVLGNLPMTLIDIRVVNQLRLWMRKTDVSVKRINNLMIPLRGAFDMALQQQKVTMNPFTLLKPLKRLAGSCSKVEDIDPFSIGEIKAILGKAGADIRNQIIFDFWSGLRTGETLALRMEDCDLPNGRITVRRSISRGVEKDTKTSRERIVYLNQVALDALKAQIALLGAPQGWVFPNPFTKERWSNESKMTKRWYKALEAAGVRPRKPYQTRHTYASMMLSAGESVMFVSNQLGHADFTMVGRVYGKWIPANMAQEGSLIAAQQADAWEEIARGVK